MANYVRLNDSYVKNWFHKTNKFKRKDISTSIINIIRFKIKCKSCGRVHIIDNATKSFLTEGFTCNNCGKGVQGTYNHYRNIPPSVQSYVIARDGNRCVYCNRRGTKNNPIEWGHHIPHHSGGCTCGQNIQQECKECNRWKGNRWVLHNNKTVVGCRKKCFNRKKTNYSKVKYKKNYREEKINKKRYGESVKDLLTNLN